MHQIDEPELVCLLVFQAYFLRLQFFVCQRQLRWSSNPVTSNVELNRASSFDFSVVLSYHLRLALETMRCRVPLLALEFDDDDDFIG